MSDEFGLDFQSKPAQYLTLNALIGSVHKTDDPILAPAFVVQFRAHRIQLSPAGGDLDAILRYPAANHGLFDPISAPLCKPKIVDNVVPS